MIEITEEINDIAASLLQRYKDAIKDSGHNASGELANTATYQCVFDGRYFEIIFELADYWKYLENGTRPHFPPIAPIENWIRVKRIVPRAIKGKVPSTQQLAFMIARSISKKGTPATKILQRTIDNSEDLVNQLVDELTKQLEEEINKDIEL